MMCQTPEFFETLYGENMETTETSGEEAVIEESMEEIPYEEAVY